MHPLKVSITQANKGSFLPMLAIMILPLIIIVGFAIDTGLMLNSKNQQALLVQHAALSALSQYVQSLADVGGADGATPTVVAEAVALTKSRAARVAKANITIIDKNIDDSSQRVADQSGDIHERASASGDSSSEAPIEAEEEATLEFGQYFYSEGPHAQEGGTGICGGNPPCFVPGSGADVEKNNAVRFTMQVTKSNPIRTFFLKFVGIESFSHKESAIATLIPRNDVFLVDLSPTVYYENYIQNDIDIPGSAAGIDTGSASQFSFTLQNVTPNGDSASRCGELQNGASRCQVMGIPAQARWNNMKYNEAELGCGPFSLPCSPATYAKSFNFRNEYDIRSVTFDRGTEYGEVSEPYIRSFLVHSRDPDSQPPESPFPKPEPLTSILRAVNKGMDILVDRALSTDNLGFFGFDSDRDAQTSYDGLKVSEKPRYFDMTVPSSQGTAGATFSEFYAATRFKTPDDFSKALNKGLFPRANSQSDLHSALFLGLKKISASPTYRFAKNSIFLFSDGRANCPHQNVPVDDPEAELEIPFSHSILGEYYACEGNSAKHLIEGIKGIVDDKFIKAFKDRSISVSMALIGQNSGAHYVARKSYTRNGCMDAIEAAKYNYEEFVLSSFEYHQPADYASGAGRAFLDRIQLDLENNKPLFIVNELYKLVRQTKGLWIPIMPPLRNSSNVIVNFRNDLENACISMSSSSPDLRIKNLSVDGIRVTDAEGRLIYDPDGRTAENQMSDAMETVLQSPFILAQ